MPLAEADRDTLARVHRELIEPAFPPAELMTLEEMAGADLDPSTHGTLLLDGDRPVAAMVPERYLAGAVRLLAYLVVRATVRGRGLGERLLRTLAPARPGGLLLAEIEDPRFHPPTEGADPVARVRFYDRLGGRLLPIPYVQPSLRTGFPRVADLLLITLGTDATDVDGSLIAAFLDEYYRLCEGDNVVEGDPAYRELRAAATGGPAGRLPLVPLARLTEARPDRVSAG